MTAEGAARPEDSTERIGKYEIVAKIGEGAMGEVYKARDTVLDRFVAIKTMSKAVLANPEMGQRFLREAQSAARLNHANVVILHEFGEDEGRFFMAMELLAGEDLARILKRGELPNLDDKLAVMEQILDGVGYAHAAGVVHRDLKPANIQIQPNGQVKVMDFGLARIGESAMTRTGTVMGTPHYMSPEQVRGEATSPASDVFALGSVFYEILGGRRAFDADSMHAVLFKVAEAQPVPLSECKADIPPILVRFVGKAMVKASELRYRDGGEMRAALELCRRVLEGSLDEAEAMPALGEAPTIMYSPGGGAEATVLEPTAGAVRAPGRTFSAPPGSRSTTAGSMSGTRRGTRVGATPPNLSGASPSVAVPPTGSGVSPAPSRLPLFVGGVIVIGLMVALLLRSPAAPVAPPVNPQAQAALRAAVEAQVDSARRSLEFKDPEAAITAAEKALSFEPENQEAREIVTLSQAVLSEVEALAAEARQAAAAGNLDGASQALANVLDRMPKHPVAAELSAQLASRFKTRADEAAKGMNRAAGAARQAGASSLRAYAEATNYAGRARSAYNRKQYTEAAQLFAEAQQSYEASARDARDLASKRVAAATPAAVVPQPSLAPPPPPVPATPRPTVVPTPAPAPTVAAPPAAPVRDDNAAIRQVVENLKRAIENKDLALYKSVRPGLTADEERRLRAAFQNVASQQVDYRIDQLAIEGDQATLKVIRGGRVAGQSVPEVQQTLRLVRRGSGWVIEEIGQ